MSFEITSPKCNGGTDGGAKVSVSGGTAPYSYVWSNGQIIFTAFNLAAGTYTVTVTDANGCSKVGSVTITNPPLLVVTTSKTDVSCGNSNDGKASAVVLGGTPSYTYKWSNNATTASINNLSAGTYTVTVTDANGCQQTSSVTILAPTLLSVTFTTFSPACNGANTGSITANPSGGTAPYFYKWSYNNLTTQTINNVPAGSYSVTITDSKGCTVVGQTSLTQPNSIVCNAKIGSNYNGLDVSAIGASDGIATVTVTGGTPGYTFLWSTGATIPTITGLAPGVYSVTVTDAAGCTCISTVTVKNPSKVGNFVFSDNNANGIQDAGEQGIEGVKVTLTGISSSGAPIMQMVFTDASGMYMFLVPAGTYQVTFATPNNTQPSPANVGTDDTKDSDAGTGGTTNPITVNPGETNQSVDAGFVPGINIGNFVWFDVNRNGIQDANEVGANGILVKLVQKGADGIYGTADDIVVATQVTRDNNGTKGYYLFENVAPGKYSIMFSNLPNGYEFTSADQSSNDQIDSDVNTTTGMTAEIMVMLGQGSNLSYDAGIRTICDNVLSGGTVGYNENICGTGGTASPMVNLVSPTGGSGIIEYQWLSSTIGPNYFPGSPDWNMIVGATSASYSPGVLTQTTYYIRCSRRGGCSDYPGESNIVSKIIVPFPFISIETAPGANVCANAATNWAAAISGANASYSWNFGTNATPTTANTRVVNSVTFGGVGTRTVVLTITINGCSVSQNVTINVTNCGPGRVEIINTKATAINNDKIEVQWQTETPTDRNVMFQIERSLDNQNFTIIGTLDAVAFGNPPYKFTDTKPALGWNFYRIRHFDTFSNQVVSQVAKARINAIDNADIEVYPNPATDRIAVQLLYQNITNENIQVQVIDVWGQILQEHKLSANQNKHEIDLESYPRGIYFVKVNYNGYRYAVKKVIKQ